MMTDAATIIRTAIALHRLAVLATTLLAAASADAASFSTAGKVRVVDLDGAVSWVVHDTPLATVGTVDVARRKDGTVEEILGPLPGPREVRARSDECPPLSPVRLADGICAPVLWPEPEGPSAPIPLPPTLVVLFAAGLTLGMMKR